MFKKLKIALLLLTLMSPSAFADCILDWIQWHQLPGKALDITEGWVISTVPYSNGYEIFRRSTPTSDWVLMQGSAVRIGGTFEAPWIVDKLHKIYHWTGSAWQAMSNSATDVADGWIVGTIAVSGGYEIYRWNGSTGWDKMPGGAVRIGGTYRDPWMVDNLNNIYHWTGSAWQQIPGSGKDVGNALAVGMDGSIYRMPMWNGVPVGDWIQIVGKANNIAGSVSNLWMTNSANDIWLLF